MELSNCCVVCADYYVYARYGTTCQSRGVGGGWGLAMLDFVSQSAIIYPRLRDKPDAKNQPTLNVQGSTKRKEKCLKQLKQTQSKTQ